MISLPPFTPKTKSEEGRTLIYDMIRKRYFIMSPEEYVRQSFVNYLVNHLGYPKSLISVERQVKLEAKSGRSDIHVLTTTGDCFMLIECKSFRSTINQDTFDQAAKYSARLRAQFLVVTNGKNTQCCAVDHMVRSIEFLSAIPPYPKD